MLVTGPLHHFLHEDSDDNIPTVDRLTRWHTYETRLFLFSSLITKVSTELGRFVARLDQCEG